MGQIQLEYTIGVQEIKAFGSIAPKQLVWMNFENLRPNDKKVLAAKYDGKISKDGQSVGISTENPSNIAFKKTLLIKDAYDFLEKTNAYEMPPFSTVFRELKFAKKDFVSPKEAHRLDALVDDEWENFMKTIDNPETQLLLQSLTKFSIKDEAYGWKYSIDNAIRARLQKPDATFILTRTQWRDKYNRDVAPDATPIRIVIPNYRGNQLGGNARTQTMKDLGHANSVSYKNLSIQQQRSVDIHALQKANASSFKYWTFYDVSDTIRRNNADYDKWDEEVGFINAFTGELNQPAKADKASKGSVDGSNGDPSIIYNGEVNEIQKVYAALVNAITSYDKFGGIQVSKPHDDSYEEYKRCFSQTLSKLSDKLIGEMCKIAKQDNRQEGISIVTTIVMCLTKIAPEVTAAKISSGELTRESYFELRNVINIILSKIKENMPKNENRSYIKESEIPSSISIEDMFTMLDIDPNTLKSINDRVRQENHSIDQAVIKEQFYNLFNRINQQLF